MIHDLSNFNCIERQPKLSFYLRRFCESRSSSGSTPSVHLFVRSHLLFCIHFMIFFSFLAVLNLRLFVCKMLRGCLVCIICNTKSFHSLIFKLCIYNNDYSYIEHVHLVFCAHLINIFLLFRSVKLRYFIHPKC